MELENMSIFRGVAGHIKLFRVSDEEHSFALQIEQESAVEFGTHQPLKRVYKVSDALLQQIAALIERKV